MREHKVERRKYPRYEISFPISFRLFRGNTRYVDSQLIEAIGTTAEGRVGNISVEGLFIEANPTKDQIGELLRMKDNPDRFYTEIEIESRVMGENVTMMGEVVWYDIVFAEDAPYHFRAGVFLQELDRETQQLWNRLIDSLD